MSTARESTRHLWFWLAVLAAFVFVVYELSAVLTPFVAGIAVAYLLNPLVEHLRRRGISRVWATVTVSLLFFLIVLLAMILLVPVIIGQIAEFAAKLPTYIEALRERVMPTIESFKDMLPPDLFDTLQGTAVNYIAPTAKWLAGLLAGMIGGGLVLVNFLSLLVITPIVAFYVMRDWDRMLAAVDSWMPRQHADTIRQQVRLVDDRLAGFIRGQGTVCLLLGIFYGVGLSLVRLDFGLVVGLLTGFLSFIPYFGMLIGTVVGLGLAIVQFHSWSGVGAVLAVFAVGQAIEGNFLTPWLVGDRVGLHPVWIMFALLAGGSLFGFVGILLAVPVAAVFGVGVRFALQRYRSSPFYLGQGGGGQSGDGQSGSGHDGDKSA